MKDKNIQMGHRKRSSVFGKARGTEGILVEGIVPDNIVLRTAELGQILGHMIRGMSSSHTPRPSRTACMVAGGADGMTRCPSTGHSLLRGVFLSTVVDTLVACLLDGIARRLRSNIPCSGPCS